MVPLLKKAFRLRGILRPRWGRIGEDCRGISLVEILVAVCILAVAIVSLTGLFCAGIWCQEKAVYTQVASVEARSTLDALTTTGYDSLAIGTANDSVADLPAGNVKTVAIQPYPTSEGDQGESTHLKLVTVRITWPDKEDQESVAGEVVYHTLIAKPYRPRDNI